MRWIVSLADQLGTPLHVLRGCAETFSAAALRLLYPPRCVLCHADLADHGNEPLICPGCQKAMVPAEWIACRRCGAPIPGESATNDRGCIRCRALRFRFDTVVALSGYRGRLREAVLRMKWAAGEPIAEAMGELLCKHRADALLNMLPDVVVPVPLHWRRRWVRKTNSPDILAARVASFLQIPCQVRLLRLNRNIAPQKGLKINERRRNLADAFRVAKGYDIRGARVLLVDDVLTTGATCDAAAKVLKTAGATSVAVVVLARTVTETDG